MMKNNRSAFTLAEIMVVMLILTILLAAFAPLMTKKSKVDLSNPWRWAGNNSDIYYGIGNNQTALLGKNSKAATDPNAHIFIQQSNNRPALTIADGSNYLSLYYNNNSGNPSLCFGGNANNNFNCGSKNVLYGPSSLSSNTTGNNNIVVGISSLTSNDTGTGNIVVGNNSLVANTKGTGNIAVGNAALALNEDSGANIAIGERALGKVVHNGRNVAIGSYALYENTGASNVAVGTDALEENTSGASNSAYGDAALAKNTTGASNVAVGAGACRNVVTGSNNICVGAGVGPAGDTSNGIWIGTASHIVHVFGNQAIESDKQLKNIKSKFTSGLDVIRGLTTYHYTYKNDKTKQDRVGIIAQDIQKVLPSAVSKNSAGYLEIKQEQVTYSMLNAIKELDKMLQDVIAQVKTLATQVANHDAQIKALQKENKELKAKIQALENKNKSFESRLKAIEKKL